MTPSAPRLTIPQADALADEIAVLSSAIYAAEARLLEKIHAFETSLCYETLGFPSTAHWLNYRCGLGMNAAREKIRVARCLQALPEIRKAFAAGRLSYSKVRAITRVATPKTDAYLAELAETATAHHMERLVGKTRRAKRAQDELQAEAIQEHRGLSVTTDASGAIEIHGRFPAEQGALIVKALEYAMDRDFRSRPDVTAETSGANVTAVTRPSFRQRRADALVDVAETFLSNPEHSGSTADRFQVVVHVTTEAGEDASADVTAVTPTLEDGKFIAESTAKRIACDCSTVAVREDEKGEPLSIGRKSRTIPPAIRRALKLRDGGCRYPGCTHSRFVDGHHIEHWADGGETSLDNLVLLCRQHHRKVHEGGVECKKTDSGDIIFVDRQRNPIPDAVPLPGFTKDLDAWLDRQVFDQRIDENSCRAKMDASDVMDYHEASIPLLPWPPEPDNHPTTLPR